MALNWNSQEHPRNILFVTSGYEDYLSDAVLHGLRQLHGSGVTDVPKQEILYANCPSHVKAKVRGHGFTLYTGLLEDIHIDRTRIIERVASGEFDLIVIGDMWRQFGWFVQLRPWLTPQNTLILDGADSPYPYPAAGHWWRRPYYWCLPRAHRRFLYFKREWTEETRFSPLSRFVPSLALARLPFASCLRKVAFSIPQEKIVCEIPGKTKLLPKHIVDSEVAKLVLESATAYAFHAEEEYYEDLRKSRFGITTRRSGWDCLRHYEIAANAAVPCFRDLHLKPETCAPHGLDESNCISYCSAQDLLGRISQMSANEYAALQRGALAWIQKQTTVVRARELLRDHRAFVCAS